MERLPRTRTAWFVPTACTKTSCAAPTHWTSTRSSLRAYRLFDYPAMVRHYQTVYRYWLIDEFQDTNGAQYELLRRMAGEHFREIFAVADDDQTIYEWNGANVRRISAPDRGFCLRGGATANELPLPTADCRGCESPGCLQRPPCSIQATDAAGPGTRSIANLEQIQCRVFATDQDENQQVSPKTSPASMPVTPRPNHGACPQSGVVGVHARCVGAQGRTCDDSGAARRFRLTRDALAGGPI